MHKLQYTTQGGTVISVNPATEIEIDGVPYDPPTEPPVEPPPEPEGEMIFDSFDENQWNYSARDIGKIPSLNTLVVYEGKQYHRITLRAQYPCVTGSLGFRNELEQTSKNLRTGQTGLWKSSFLLPRSHKWSRTYDVYAWAQSHANTGVGPPWIMQIREDRSMDLNLRIGTKSNHRQKRYNIKDAWDYDTECFCKILYKPHYQNGTLKLWINDRLEVDHKGGVGVQGFDGHRYKGGYYTTKRNQNQLNEFNNICKEWIYYVGRTTVEIVD